MWLRDSVLFKEDWHKFSELQKKHSITLFFFFFWSLGILIKELEN